VFSYVNFHNLTLPSEKDTDAVFICVGTHFKQQLDVVENTQVCYSVWLVRYTREVMLSWQRWYHRTSILVFPDFNQFKPRDCQKQVYASRYRVAKNLENLEYSGTCLNMQKSWNSQEILCNLGNNDNK